MPKRDIPVGASDEIKFQIIMEGLVQSSHRIPPKDGRIGAQEKWRVVGEKTIGLSSGCLVSKNATPNTRKHEQIWMYKFFADQSGVVNKFFYAMFVETVGGELFRYVLGDAAPKIRLTQIGNQAPGIVSRFLPEFTSFKDLQRPLDEEQRILFRKQLLNFEGLSEVMAANCFLNDHDGRFENVGLYRTAEMKYQVGRIDFGTALSQLNNPIYCLGIYLFGKGSFDPRYHYVETYGPLLKSEQFRLAIQQLSTINLNHIEAITRASVACFVDSWRNVPLNELSINKLFTHLLGAEKSCWVNYGYIDGQPVQMNLDQFNQTISEAIISSMRRRKDIFSFFAKALESHVATTDDSIQASPLTQLKQEAMHDQDKAQLLEWLEMAQTPMPEPTVLRI